MRKLLAVLGIIAALIGVRAPARATSPMHATLIGSEPAANAHLPASPPRIRLLFNEQIEPGMAQLTVVADDGRSTKLSAAGNPRDVRAVIAQCEPLAPGAYRLVWRVVSADGHPVEGSFAFWVGATTEAAPDSASAESASVTMGPTIFGAPLLAAVLRGAGMGCLLALTGLLFFAAGTPEAASGARRTPTWLAASAAVLLSAHLIVWMMNAAPDHSLGGDSTGAILASHVGKLEMWRAGLVVAVAWAVLLARRDRLAQIFATAAVLVSGATGHSGAIHAIWATPAKALHLLGAAAWLGGLVWLATRDTSDRSAFVRDAGRVSQTALIAVIVIAASGTLQAFLFLPSVLDVVHSAYGAVLLAKTAGFALLMGFGVFHRYRVLPRLDDDIARSGFGATIRAEIGVMVVVLLLSGLLAYISPPHAVPMHDHMMTAASTHA